jgi:hypothetical protein
MECKNCEAQRLCQDNPHVRCGYWGKQSKATQGGTAISELVTRILNGQAKAGRKSNNLGLA